MLKLVISDDEGQTTVVPLLRDEITIGRQEGNTIRLTERNVSRNHARLVKRNGSYVVEDLGSYNGVTLNGERLDEAAELSSGDQLGIGDYALAIQSDAPPVRPTPAPRPSSVAPPRLVVLSEPAAGAEFSLNQPVVRVGRDERLDIWINHKSISHEHAEIQIAEGVVTVFDLESANGIRINGVNTKRGILESGDELEIGDVRFRFIEPRGTHLLEPLPNQPPVTTAAPTSRKPVFALGVIALLAAAGAGAVLVTMKQPPPPGYVLETKPMTVRVEEGSMGASASSTRVSATSSDSLEAAPREWESVLTRAQAELAWGRIDRAFATANELPPDSVLRETPEFGEIRYRYAQSHIAAGEKALVEAEPRAALEEAQLVLALEGITTKQRRDARRLLQRARRERNAPSHADEDPLSRAHRCVAEGDNACVIRALESGRARSPEALALLIEAYRAMDDLPASRRHMRRFVERFPEDRRTPRYREMLASK